MLDDQQRVSTRTAAQCAHVVCLYTDRDVDLDAMVNAMPSRCVNENRDLCQAANSGTHCSSKIKLVSGFAERAAGGHSRLFQ